MRRSALALFVTLLLSSGVAAAMKNGTVKFFNEAKGFGFIKAEVGYIAAGTSLDIDAADLALKKGLNAVNVKLARVAGGAAESDGLGLYAVVHEPGAEGPAQPKVAFVVRRDDWFDVVFEVSASAAARRKGIIVFVDCGRSDVAIPECGGQPIELQFEWPAGALPDRGNLVVQVRLPIAAIDDKAKVEVRGWNPRLLGATFPDATIDFLGSADHVTLTDGSGLDAHAFDGWVSGTALGPRELATIMAAGAKIPQADAERMVETMTSTDAAAKGSNSPSGLGTFRVYNRPALAGRDPITGGAVELRAKKVAKFKAGAELAKTVNK